jgi:hypothetical protein
MPLIKFFGIDVPKPKAWRGVIAKNLRGKQSIKSYLRSVQNTEITGRANSQDWREAQKRQ